MLYSLKAKSAYLTVCQYFFSWKEKTSHHVMRLHKAFCKEQNSCNSPRNLVIAPFYKVNCFLVLLCTGEIAGATLHLVINYMSYQHLNLWLYQVKLGGVWNCNVPLTPWLLLSSQPVGAGRDFFPTCLPPLQTFFSGSGLPLLNLPFLSPYYGCLILAVLTF